MLPAPPGTWLAGLGLPQGDGFRDGVMRFSGPLASVQHALAALSYQVCSRMLTYAHVCSRMRMLTYAWLSYQVC